MFVFVRVHEVRDIEYVHTVCMKSERANTLNAFWQAISISCKAIDRLRAAIPPSLFLSVSPSLSLSSFFSPSVSLSLPAGVVKLALCLGPSQID